MLLYKKTKIRLFLSSLFFVLIFANSYNILSAQTSADPISAKEEELKKELENIEKEILIQNEILKSKQRESVSIERDISILNAKIKEAQLNIKAKNLKISGLSKDIAVKSKDIESLEQKIEKGKDSIGDLLRKSYQIDDTSLLTVALSDNDLSQFFIDIDSFDSIKRSLQFTLEDVRETKGLTEKQKESLNARKDQETDAKVAIESEKRKVEKNEGEKKQLLGINRKQEKAYKEILKEREAKAAKIRNALFALRDTSAIPFGKALEYANLASSKTGVRPAFLLEILTQESNLGQNIGSCYLKSASTGEGVSLKSGNSFPNVMKPGRDVNPFMEITKEVGRDPYTTPVSCPQAGVGGWGGAMGPSQFIPSTWQLFKERIAGIVGKLIPNPWDPKDAIIASSIYLGDLGADSGSYSAEKNAACKYYSGKSCSQSKWASTYGNQVMNKAQNIQETMIDILQGN
ncbi:MAG: 2 protein [Parcubacteria group bacterium]|nr:2 protein [Parcubacteria group bacterium]